MKKINSGLVCFGPFKGGFFYISPSFQSHLYGKTPQVHMHMGKQTCKVASWITTDMPPLFTLLVDIPHRAAKPGQSQRGKEGFSDTRLMSPGSCGQKQHSEEETSQKITGGCCFSLCCVFFFLSVAVYHS